MGHPVFSKFKPFPGPQRRDAAIDFIGGVFHKDYLADFAEPDELDIPSPEPPYNEEYFEWIDLLESVDAAAERFVFIELGAGYGRWSTRAFLAARQLGLRDVKIIAVEAEPHYARVIPKVFSDNGMPEESYRVVHGAIAPKDDGRVFIVQHPTEHEQHVPFKWYGQMLQPPTWRPAPNEMPGDALYDGYEVVPVDEGWGGIKVPIVTLEQVLRDEDHVDLIDMDIQGEERRVVATNVDLLSERAKKLHIGTHDRDIDQGLLTVLSNAGWICRRAYLWNSKADTPFGEIEFQDGVQTWINPRFLPPDPS